MDANMQVRLTIAEDKILYVRQFCQTKILSANNELLYCVSGSSQYNYLFGYIQALQNIVVLLSSNDNEVSN